MNLRLAALAVASAICSMVAPAGADERLLGLALTEVPQRSYDQAARDVSKIGVRYAAIPLQWDEIETSPGTYEPNPDLLAIATSYYPTLGWSVALEINPIDTVADRRPKWLKRKSWSDPEVIAAFRALLVHVLKKSEGVKLTSLAIGNEVDVFLSANPKHWDGYKGFVESAVAAAKDLRPGVPVGVKATFSGLSGDLAEPIKDLNNVTDIVMLTYYPLGVNFRARDPSTTPKTDLAAMVRAFPGRKIHIAEVGYPSSKSCAGGEDGQSKFVKAFFAAWDTYSSAIDAVYWDWMTDVSPDQVASYQQYYGVNQPCFAEFLATLGLETHDLKPKKAWARFSQEAAKRFH